MVCITGVSGSGKSTLVEEVLYRGLLRRRGLPTAPPGACDGIDGAEKIAEVIFVDQAPLGTTPRANAATYTKMFDRVRRLFAATEHARLLGFSAATFSFNVEGGRCETCRGEGFEKVEMQFLSDVLLVCPACNGRRFGPDVLEVRYRDRSIADVLELTVREALAFFADQPEIVQAVAAARRRRPRLPAPRPAAQHALGGRVATHQARGPSRPRRESAHALHLRRADDGTALRRHRAPARRVREAQRARPLAPRGRAQRRGHQVRRPRDRPRARRRRRRRHDRRGGTPEDVAACAASHTGRFLAPVAGGSRGAGARRGRPAGTPGRGRP